MDCIKTASCASSSADQDVLLATLAKADGDGSPGLVRLSALKAAMNEATGGVLFIDEAYDLATSSYGTEALTELVGMMTLPEHLNITMVILAGYKSDMCA